MSTRTENPTARPAVDGVKGARMLIVEARYYAEIADALIAGAERESRRRRHGRARHRAGRLRDSRRHRAGAAEGRYDGFVALGCVIRGETTHYDYVCGESARGLMDLRSSTGWPSATASSRSKNEDQAWARAATDRGDKGGDAAHACLAMVALARRWRNRERPTAPKPTPSRRQAARLAAVQALYQWQEGQHAPAEIIEQFLNVRTGEAGEGGMRRDADKPLFRDVVEGTAAHKDELEQTVSAALPRTGPGSASTGSCARCCWPAPTNWCIAGMCRRRWRSTNMSRSRTPSTTGRADLHQFGARSRGAPGAAAELVE